MSINELGRAANAEAALSATPTEPVPVSSLTGDDQPRGGVVFAISAEQQKRVQAWLDGTVYPAVIKAQKRSRGMRRNPVAADCWEMGFPYSGAIGGGLTYEFTNTSIGQVQAAVYGEHRLDLTDYGFW